MTYIDFKVTGESGSMGAGGRKRRRKIGEGNKLRGSQLGEVVGPHMSTFTSTEMFPNTVLWVVCSFRQDSLKLPVRFSCLWWHEHPLQHTSSGACVIR